MATADRRRAELAFCRQIQKRITGRTCQRRMARQPVLWPRERPSLRVELLEHKDAAANRIDVSSSQGFNSPDEAL